MPKTDDDGEFRTELRGPGAGDEPGWAVFRVLTQGGDGDRRPRAFLGHPVLWVLVSAFFYLVSHQPVYDALSSFLGRIVGPVIDPGSF